MEVVDLNLTDTNCEKQKSDGDSKTNDQKSQANSNQPELGFIILTCAKSIEQVKMTQYNIDQLTRLYPGCPIVILDDWSSVSLETHLATLPPKVKIARTPYRGSGGGSPMEYYLRNPFAARILFLQDSVQVVKSISHLPTTVDIAFLATHTIPAEIYLLQKNIVQQTPFYVSKGISNSHQLVMFLMSHCTNKAFSVYFHSMYGLFFAQQKRILVYRYPRAVEWKPWWGMMGVMTHDFVVKFEERTSILSSIVPLMGTRYDREAAEFIFGIGAKYTHAFEYDTSIPIMGGNFLGISGCGHFEKLSFGR